MAAVWVSGGFRSKGPLYREWAKTNDVSGICGLDQPKEKFAWGGKSLKDQKLKDPIVIADSIVSTLNQHYFMLIFFFDEEDNMDSA